MLNVSLAAACGDRLHEGLDPGRGQRLQRRRLVVEAQEGEQLPRGVAVVAEGGGGDSAHLTEKFEIGADETCARRGDSLSSRPSSSR